MSDACRLCRYIHGAPAGDHGDRSRYLYDNNELCHFVSFSRVLDMCTNQVFIVMCVIVRMVQGAATAACMTAVLSIVTYNFPSNIASVVVSNCILFICH